MSTCRHGLGIGRRAPDLSQAHWVRWALVAALVALYGGWIAYVVHRNKALDFNVYYLAASAFLNDQNAYEISDHAWDNLAADLGITNYTRPYRYPPLTAQIIVPLTLLPPPAAAAAWLALSAAAAITAAWWLALVLDTPFRWLLALGGLLLFVPPLATLHAGQVNLLLLAGLALALRAFHQQRPALLGIALAVGTSLKVIPLALIGYLLWRGQWRALAVAAVVICLLLLAATPLIGWDGLSSYLHKAVQLGEPGRLFSEPTNQTFNGFFARLLTEHRWGWALTDNPALASTLSLVCSVVLVLATMGVCYPAGDARAFFSLEFALIVTALQLIPPFTWYHQLALLLIPFVILVQEVLAAQARRWFLVLALGYTATNLHGLVWHDLEGMTLLQSTPFYTMLMLWGILAHVIVSRKRDLTQETLID